ncbi:MAG: hypothetical protein CO013_06615 [Syntrophobacterales bacterium CG_4_8_14_3_um_filter_58_8]|nr:MAG: hypothetical protein AUK26_01575 [Syntrophaceae bacterium CG2_30_58_14]PIV07289.1 MAG: hypothetical protein COS57_00495 [Syntrophobacterales bacterium CG03_land_8_20_14_0_80_58_14]PJC73565.1 MAG: hypothetical protein CO013_06615 [Syntrophobacterales bacterium CG_4_8_14_3_um_filter_58_8]
MDDDACGVQSLLDSIATVGEQEKLREVAQRNLETVKSIKNHFRRQGGKLNSMDAGYRLKEEG